MLQSKAPRFRMPNTLDPTKMDVCWREFCRKTNSYLGIEEAQKFEYDDFMSARSSDDEENASTERTSLPPTGTGSGRSKRTGRTGRTEKGSSRTTNRTSARPTTRREELLDTVRRVEELRKKKQEELEELLEKERKRRRMMDEKYFNLVRKIAAQGSAKRFQESKTSNKPKRVQTRHKLGHHVILHHPQNQNMIRRTARMTSATPNMFGSKSSRKPFLKANKDNRHLPNKTKKWPHY